VNERKEGFMNVPQGLICFFSLNGIMLSEKRKEKE
jgi:hypothetical protein